MMYQIHVTADGKDLPVGPIVDVRRFLEPLAQMINTSVAKGTERNWADARIVTIQTIRKDLQ